MIQIAKLSAHFLFNSPISHRRMWRGYEIHRRHWWLQEWDSAGRWKSVVVPFLGIPMKQPDGNLGMDFAVQVGQQPRLLTKSEVAAYAHCTTRCIDNWMRRGYLPYFKIGRTVRFKVADVEAYLSNHFRVARRSRPANDVEPSAERPGYGSGSASKAGQLGATTEVRSFSSATSGTFGEVMENHFAASSGRTNSR